MSRDLTRRLPASFPSCLRAAGVQNARELQEKAAILDDYLRTEKDAHYRSAGEHWRRELMSRA